MRSGEVPDNSTQDSGDGVDLGARAELDRLLQGLPERRAEDAKDDDETTTALAQVLLSERYRGAFPHPSNLKDFDSVVENGAERAFALTEREQSHRHECDRKLTDLEVECRRSEMRTLSLIVWLTFISVVLSLGATTALAIFGFTIGAGVVGGATAIAGISGAVIYRKKRAEGSQPSSQ